MRSPSASVVDQELGIHADEPPGPAPQLHVRVGLLAAGCGRRGCAGPAAPPTEKSSDVPSMSCWLMGAPQSSFQRPRLEDHAPHVRVHEPHLERDLPALAVRSHRAGRDGRLDELRGLVQAARRLLLQPAAEDQRLVAGGRRVPQHQRLEGEHEPAQQARAQQHPAAAVDDVPVDPHRRALDRPRRRRGSCRGRLRRARDPLPARSRSKRRKPPAFDSMSATTASASGIDAREERAEAIDPVAEARAGFIEANEAGGEHVSTA